ncbi:MAG: lysine--tRNA ligase [Spirochaetales bacterium]|nr:lysine--tRNA ligase [Spirochaetales bacterium]
MVAKSTHWADLTADKIVREKGEKDVYVCASGITPSGTVHIGNFREIISVELVVRALKEKGLNAKFIYSWDEYDVFRKVPANMPEQEKLAQFLRQPITLVPDVLGNEESYARANEKRLEALLPLVGVFPEYIYQASEYRSGRYAQGMRTALEKKDTIRAILDEHRTQPLSADWMPVSVFCTKCHRDTTKVENWDGEWHVEYSCASCGNKESLDLRETGAVKLPWRIDWPMRWKEEGVDFEPAGKDHHSEGGSFDTAEMVVEKIFDGTPPVSFQYDFIRIKGRGGKISSSSGEVVSLPDVLEVYQPEVVRYMFAGTRPNTEFAISFDLDVLKIYEDYDKCERAFYNKPDSEKALKKWEKQARIYELSQVDRPEESMPYQIQIRHLCNLLQIQSGDIDKVIENLGDVEEDQIPRFRQRAECAWAWVQTFAPEDFRFSIKTSDDPLIEVSAAEASALSMLADAVKAKMDILDEKEFSTNIYAAAEENGLESGDFFPVVYRALIGKEKGPRLASFLYSIGSARVFELISRYSA